MQTFTVRELESSDCEALLAFETENREWFESQIDARPASFYSLQGVAKHIEGYLSGLANGTWHPFVIEDSSGEIVGRANLKDIDLSQGSAEVGYRIDQRYCGLGLGTLALRHLIQEAQVRWGLTQLVAYAYEGNVGSRKVLGRCGFLVEDLSLDDETGDECRFVLSI
jgi:[ribosomal protein S5]-alanine N-acetyltransferase